MFNSEKKKVKMVEDTTNKIREIQTIHAGIIKDMSSFDQNNIATLDNTKLKKTQHRVDRAYKEMRKLSEELERH